MRSKRSILWLVSIVAVLLALVMLLTRKPIDIPLLPADQTNVAPQTSVARAVTETAQTSNLSTRNNSAIVPTELSPPMSTKAKQMKEGLAALNDEDVVLYGRVTDQFNAPVASATVAGSIQVNNGIREASDKISILTDANGLFTIDGYKGKILGINVRKAGYVMATTNTRFIYSRLWSDAERHNPDPNNPVAIKLWKLQGSEPLTQISQRFKFHFTDAPVHFDLLAGEIVSTGGDITLTLSRSPGIVSERTLQEWSVQVEAVSGGVIDVPAMESRVTYALPSDGYKPSDTFILSTNTPHQWSGSIDQMYYIRSRSGQVFAKVDVSVAINQQPDDFIWVEFHGEANPNSSVNFEADAYAMTMKPQ